MLAVLRIIICVQIMELVSFISLSSAMNFSKSLYGVFPVPIGQFISVTYLRRTGGKRLTFSLGPRDPKRFGRTK